MARIRSLHPGQWTSGDFLECTPLARLLALAIRNVADDHGAFRWKPTSLKAECLPADNCNIHALLDELVTNKQIVRYLVDDKEYGLVRDFTQWQRPQKPKYVHPLPEWLELGQTKSEIGTIQVQDPSSTDTGKYPQRKEGGGMREEERGKREEVKDGGGGERDGSAPTDEPKQTLVSQEAFALIPKLLRLMGDPEPGQFRGAPYIVQSWLNAGWPEEAITIGIQLAMRTRSGVPPKSLKYFEKAIARTHADFTRVLPMAKV